MKLLHAPVSTEVIMEFRVTFGIAERVLDVECIEEVALHPDQRQMTARSLLMAMHVTKPDPRTIWKHEVAGYGNAF